MGIRITTNHHRREVIDAWNLPPEVRGEFDYIDWPAIERGEDSASFVRYRGQWFDLGDIPRIENIPLLSGWDGYVSDTYFSGTVFRWVQDDPPYSDDWLIIVGSFFVGDESCPNCHSGNVRGTASPNEWECQDCGTVFFTGEDGSNA
jgi:hypothetical protein